MQNLATWAHCRTGLLLCDAGGELDRRVSTRAASSVHLLDRSQPGPGGVPVTITGYRFSGANIVHFGRISIPTSRSRGKSALYASGNPRATRVSMGRWLYRSLPMATSEIRYFVEPKWHD